MVSLDVFNQDPFSAAELTAAIERIPYLPDGIGQLDLFDLDPIRTRVLMVEQREGKLVLIPFTDRGAPGTQRTTELRTARHFEVPRIRVEDTIKAAELQDIREIGTESVLMQVQKELARRLTGPTGLRSLLHYTMEYHRLAAVQGLLLDADGSVKFNWFTEFGIAPPAEIVFNFPMLAATYSGQTGNLRPLLNSIIRAMQRASRGAWVDGKTRVAALCGDAFFDQLVSVGEVRSTYLNWVQAQELRENLAFETFPWGGIDWINYRGSDDTSGVPGATTNGSGVVACGAASASMVGDQVSGPNIPSPSTIGSVNPGVSFTLAGGATATATSSGFFNIGSGDSYSGGGAIAIPSNKAKFFPRFAPGVFQLAYAPQEDFDYLNTLGKPEYTCLIPDRDRKEFVKLEMTSYPLHICTRPEMLFTGTADATDD